MNYLQSVEAILGSVDRITADSGKLQDRIHRTAMSATRLFFNKEIDGQMYAELMTSIQSASPYHSAAFANWVGMMTPLMWSDETKSWYAHKDSKIKESQFLEARDNPFWEVSPPKAPKPYNIIDALRREVAKADKRAEDSTKGTSEDIIPEKLVSGLKKLLVVFENEAA